ncbi:MAG: hypothetical protein ACLTIF_08660 [Lachnospiraceae bacterium]
MAGEIKKNVPWHILAPRRGCFSNHLPLHRVRILAERFYRMETKFPYDKNSACRQYLGAMQLLSENSCMAPFVFSKKCGPLVRFRCIIIKNRIFAAFQGKVLRNTLPFAIIRLYGQILPKYRLICQKTLPPLVTTAKERALWRSNYRT